MTKPKRENYSHLYSLSDQGDIAKWSVMKQGNIYIEVDNLGTGAEYQRQKIQPFTHSFKEALSIKAWCTTDARFSHIGLFFASREDAAEYQRLYREHQAKLAKPKEDKLVKIKHLMEQAFKSLEEAKKLQESFDDL